LPSGCPKWTATPTLKASNLPAVACWRCCPTAWAMFCADQLAGVVGGPRPAPPAARGSGQRVHHRAADQPAPLTAVVEPSAPQSR
jgi:hypothetical protein